MTTLPYAFEINGRASAIPIALWMTRYEHKQGELDERFSLSFAPIHGAFIACARASENRASVAIGREDIVFGRTNDAGWAVQRTLDQLASDEGTPSAPSVLLPAPAFWFLSSEDPVTLERSQRVARDLICGLPNEAYRIFFCHDYALFRRFASELEQDPQQAFDDWGARSYVMEPFGKSPSLKGLDLLNEREQKGVARLLLSGERQGYHAGWYFEDRTTAAIFDATPAPLRALYLSEWLEWYSAQLRTDKNWRALVTALHVSEISQHGGKVEQFDAEAREYMARTMLANVGGAAAGVRDWQGFWDYRRYAHECAKACAKLGAEERRDFRLGYLAALEVRERDGNWVVQAQRLRQRYGVLHPAHTGHFSADDDLELASHEARDPFIAYFDYYLEGLRYAWEGVVSQIEGAETAVLEAFGWLEQKRRNLLKQAGRYDRLTAAIARAVLTDDEALVKSLYDRYTRQCAALKLVWWLDADQGYLASAAQWRAFAQKTGWVGNLGNGVSSLLGAFVATHALIHDHDLASARAAVRFCLRTERWLSAGLLDAVELEQGVGSFSYSVRGKHVRLSIDVYRSSTDNKLTGYLDGGEYRLLKEVKVDSLQPAGGSGPAPDSFRAVTMSKLSERELLHLGIGKRRVDLACDPSQVKRLDSAAGIVGDLANLINAALAVRTLASEQEQGIQYFSSREVQSASWSVLQGIGSVAHVVQSIRAAQSEGSLSLKSLTWAGRAGAVGLALESAYGLQQGVTALYSEGSDALAKLDQGDRVGGVLEMLKGTAQVSAGIGGLGSAALALYGGLSLAAAPFALVFGVGMVLVVVTESSIYARASSENRVRPLIDRVEQARRSEFQLDARGHAAKGEAEAPLLRQRIAVLNGLLSQNLPTA
jgi:hypothetical protein